jgi:hypothetical protein
MEPIIALINDTYDKFLTPKAASRNFCIAIGSSIKKPIKVLTKLNLKQQQEFIKQHHELKNKVSTSLQKEVILFLDGVHPDHQTQVSYGWMKKGSKLAIKTTAAPNN